jgi:hypothetical protein
LAGFSSLPERRPIRRQVKPPGANSNDFNDRTASLAESMTAHYSNALYDVTESLVESMISPTATTVKLN